ncbi:MAG: hypothetical protein Q4P29_05250 [Tissierellia bacterium]|nr:hypothetical protein [Tissierellia bacterium]
MKKKFSLLLFLIFILFFSACDKETNLYDLKTNLTNEDKVLKIIETLNWSHLEFKDFEIEDKDLIIFFEGENDLKRDPKAVFANSVLLNILIEDLENLSLYNDELIFGIDTEGTEMILEINFDKNIEDYRNSKDELNKLPKKLNKIKIE